MSINNKTLQIFLLFVILREIIGKECLRRDYGETSFVCVCNSNYCDSIEPVPKHLESNEYVTYTSTKDELRMKQRIIKTSNFEFRSSTPDMILSRKKRYQKIIGFGGCWTDATGINIADLPKATQDILMEQYFGDKGIQYTVLRIPIGGTDNSLRGYTLDDVANDTELVHFKLSDEDLMYRIPFLKQAIELSSYPIHLMAASWSSPAYMKTNKLIRGMGILMPEYYQIYANYLIKFLQEYQKHELKFSSLSAQNEPVMGGTPIVHFNGMAWNPLQQTDFIMNNLHPTLAKNGFDDVQILVGDDQRLFIFYWMLEMLTYRPNITKYFGGIGIHWYLDVYTSPNDLTIIHHMPGLEDKFMMYTEGCESGLVGIDPSKSPGVALGNWRNGERYLSSIIETLNHWSQGWVDWNLALDETGGPIWVFNIINAPIIVNKTSGEFYKNAMYYAMGHASKFLVPGSIRIDMINNQKKIQATAFDTPDNRTVIVLINLEGERIYLPVHDVERQRSLNLHILPYSFMTVIY